MSQQPGYLRYLPAVYATTEPGFLIQYLKIFEKIFSGLSDAQLDGRKGIHELLQAEVIGNLFYARLSFLFPPTDTSFVPPISGANSAQEKAILDELNSYIGVPESVDPLADFITGNQTQNDPQEGIKTWLNDFLIWLGSWYDLLVDNSWSIDKKRNVLQQSMALYRMRGTPQGLSFALNLLLDLPLSVGGVKYDDQGKQQPATGNITVTLANPVVAAIPVAEQAESGFILADRYLPGAPVVGGNLPWLFLVNMQLPNYNDPSFYLTKATVQQIQTLHRQLQQTLQVIKPAASNFIISISPSMQLQATGRASILDENTLLGNEKSNKESTT